MKKNIIIIIQNSKSKKEYEKKKYQENPEPKREYEKHSFEEIPEPKQQYEKNIKGDRKKMHKRKSQKHAEKE